MTDNTDTITRRKIISENIRKQLNIHRMKQIDLAKKAGISKSALSDYLNLRSAPSFGVIQKIADVFGVKKTDIDSTFKDDNDGVIHLANSNSYNYFNAGLSAGVLMEVDPFTRDDTEQIVLSDVIMGKYAGDKDIFISHVNGESMNRVIPNESLIAIKKFQSINDLTNGDIVVFQDGGDMSIKRFYNDPNSKIITFSPDSYDVSFRPINYRYEDFGSVKIVGKVVVYTVEV
ncbi:XRE family transcriptional regulator [Companilactobacillus crustorum]|uniref:LexA family transcriptional regulator n=1 Tax=Companilactobacillus crustorum TaxID=392416 RepID=UPI00237EB9A5|nr:XRE family transcriptional regulator [Companilactobacillus crustorum]WDT66071.1 XRE family transcriptional regulator [Companilactobacillus crustorum]